MDQALLSSKVDGHLERIPVDIGSRVLKGDLLAQLDARDYQLRLQQSQALLAQARVRLGLPLDGSDDSIDPEKTSPFRQTRAILEEARANGDRIQKLAAAAILSPAELDTAQSAYLVALSRHQDALEDVRMRQALVAQRRAELEIARQQLTDTSIHAPFDGVIEERLAHQGEYIRTGSPLLKLVRTHPLRLRLEIPERDAAQVQLNQKIRFTIEGNPQSFSGQITRISPVIDEQTRILIAEADVPNPGPLRPGAFVRAEIIVDDKIPVLIIPAGALTTFAGLEKVYVVRNGKAVEITVTTNRRSDDAIEVRSGLKPGDLVILNPGQLQTGQPVAAANSKHAEAR